MATERQRRQAAVGTTAVGVGTAAAGGALRQTALDRHLKTTGLTKPPRWYKGGKTALLARGGTKALRGRYSVGSALGLIGTTGTAVGINELTRHRKPEDAFVKADGLIQEGIRRNLDAVRQRGENLKEKKPAGILASTTAISLGGGGGAAGAMHGILDHKIKHGAKISSGKRGLLTAATGALAAGGIQRATAHGIERQFPGYEVTPVGVKRKKTPNVRPSTTVKQVDQRHGKRAFRQAVVGKSLPVRGYDGSSYDRHDEQAAARANRHDPELSVLRRLERQMKKESARKAKLQDSRGKFSRDSSVAKMGERAAARYTTGAFRLADRIAPKTTLAKPGELSRTKSATRLVRTGMSRRVQGLATNPAPLARPFEELTKLDSRSSNHARRAAITGAGSVPVAGDFMSAATAAHLAPKGQQHKAGATQLAGNLSAYPGSLVGAVAANRLLPKARAAQLDAKLENAKAGVRRRVGLKPPVAKPARVATSRGGRALQHLGRPLKTPAGKIGALAGGLVLGQVGAQSATSLNFRREKHAVSKLAPGAALPTKREQRDTLKRKRRTLAAGAFASGAGLTSLGLLGASVATKKPKLAAQLKDASYASGVVAGAVGGAQGLRNASLQRRDLNRQEAVLHKSLLLPTKQATMRASSLATRRTRSGMLVTTRRAGGVVR